MSKIASWSYKNTATIRPILNTDQWGGESTYGPEYEIACNFIGKSEAMRESGGDGIEFVSKNVVYTEDPRPKYRDLIKLNGEAEFERIRYRGRFDMAMFKQSEDYMLVT